MVNIQTELTRLIKDYIQIKKKDQKRREKFRGEGGVRNIGVGKAPLPPTPKQSNNKVLPDLAKNRQSAKTVLPDVAKCRQRGSKGFQKVPMGSKLFQGFQGVPKGKCYQMWQKMSKGF